MCCGTWGSGAGVIFVAMGADSADFITSFSLSTSSMALFGRVGGIYAKQPTLGLTLWAKSKRGYRKTIREIQPLLPTM